MKSLFFTSFLTILMFSAHGQMDKKPKTLYIVTFEGEKVMTPYLFILPGNVEKLEVLSQKERSDMSQAKGYDVVIAMTPKSNVKLLKINMLLDIFKVAPESKNLPVYINHELIKHVDDIIAEYPAISSIKVDSQRKIIDITTTLQDQHPNEKMVH